MGVDIRRTKEKAIETRNLILKAALKVFNEKGYSATTLGDIAKEADISRGAIYWNFKNKQDLYVNLLREYFFNNIYEYLTPTVNCHENSVDALKEYIYNYFRILLDHEGIRQIIEITKYKTEVKTEMNEVWESQQQMDTILKEGISKLVKEGAQAGEIRSDINDEVLTMSVLSYLNGIEDTWLTNPDIFDLDKHLQELIDLYINAVVKK